MRVHAGLILFLGAMIISALVVGLYHSQQEAFSNSAADSAPRASGVSAQITSVSVYGVVDQTAAYATIEFEGGDEPLVLDELVVTLQTGSGSQDFVLVD